MKVISQITLASADYWLNGCTGGPGSGKITHCERLAIMDERLVHLNMMLAFLEIATEMGSILIVNCFIMISISTECYKIVGSQDPNIVPAYKALEILIERISAIEKDVSGALIISGYPRNMRDVVEYMARVYPTSTMDIKLQFKKSNFYILSRFNGWMVWFCWIGATVVLNARFNWAPEWGTSISIWLVTKWTTTGRISFQSLNISTSKDIFIL